MVAPLLGMNSITNISDLPSRLEYLLEEARATKPLGAIRAPKVLPTHAQRRVGFLAGKYTIPDDFDRLGQEEIAKLFGSH